MTKIGLDTAVLGLGLMSQLRNIAIVSKSIRLLEQCFLICKMSLNEIEVINGNF
jgi:hypothetical protein